MHNKLWIADNAVAVAGGRNLGDQYFEALPEHNFADLDLLIAGPVVGELSDSFDAYWNSAWATPAEAFLPATPDAAALTRFEATLEERIAAFRDTPYAKAARESTLAGHARAGQFPLTFAPAQAYADRPRATDAPGTRETTGLVQSKLRPLIEAARSEVALISPYFVPSDRGVEMLGQLVARGVRVRVLTNSLASTDVPAVHTGYARRREQLLARGVEIHEFRPQTGAGDDAAHGERHRDARGSLHAKAVVIDRAQIVVGSMNLDPRSRALNTEVAVFVQSTALGARLGVLFDEAVAPQRAFSVTLAEPGVAGSALVWTSVEDGRSVRYTQEPLAGFWRRFSSSVLGLFVDDDML